MCARRTGCCFCIRARCGCECTKSVFRLTFGKSDGDGMPRKMVALFLLLALALVPPGNIPAGGGDRHADAESGREKRVFSDLASFPARRGHVFGLVDSPGVGQSESGAETTRKRVFILATAAPEFARTPAANRTPQRSAGLEASGYFLALRSFVVPTGTADTFSVTPSLAVVMPIPRSPPSALSFVPGVFTV